MTVSDRALRAATITAHQVDPDGEKEAARTAAHHAHQGTVAGTVPHADHDATAGNRQVNTRPGSVDPQQTLRCATHYQAELFF